MSQQETLNLVDFIKRFPNEDACRKYLFELRWPEGFKCPRCENSQYYHLAKYHLYQCTNCNYQASVTAGTVMHKTKISLFKWFIALFLVATDKRGCAALTIQRHIEVNYKTAWLMLHKARSAMGKRDSNYNLEGIVQLDEAYFGAPKGKQGRGTEKTVSFVAVSTAVSDKQAVIPLFAKIKITEKLSLETATDFVTKSIEPGSKLVTDCFRIYSSMIDKGFSHEQYLSGTPECNKALDWTHILISNAKAFILGTYHGLAERHLQAYFDEFCYRFNRRQSISQLFPRLLNACMSAPAFTWAELTG